MTDKAEQMEKVAEAALAVQDALVELRNAISHSPLQDTLRHGAAADVGRAPYELRNMLADLEGQSGGWLQQPGEAFIEQIDTLEVWAREMALQASPPDVPACNRYGRGPCHEDDCTLCYPEQEAGDATCEWCGEPADDELGPIAESVISPPVSGYQFQTMRGHAGCTAAASRQLVE
jgi:hypothetical protein